MPTPDNTWLFNSMPLLYSCNNPATLSKANDIFWVEYGNKSALNIATILFNVSLPENKSALTTTSPWLNLLIVFISEKLTGDNNNEL